MTENRRSITTRNIEADRQFLIDCIKTWIVFLDDQEEYGEDELKLWTSMKEALRKIDEA